jgi:hypothetical protein
VTGVTVFEHAFPSDTPSSTITLGNGAGDSVDISGNIPSTITLGDGAGDSVKVLCVFGGGAFPMTVSTITVGNGDNDNVTVTIQGFFANDTDVAAVISVGDGNNDVVNAATTIGSIINVGNGNDTIHVGTSSTVTVGTGQDGFVFDQTIPGGTATINKFNVASDTIDFSQIGGLNDHVQPVPINFFTSTPATIAAHTIDVVTSSGNTSVYANASPNDETIGSPAIGTQDIAISLIGVTTLSSSNFILHH